MINSNIDDARISVNFFVVEKNKGSSGQLPDRLGLQLLQTSTKCTEEELYGCFFRAE